MGHALCCTCTEKNGCCTCICSRCKAIRARQKSVGLSEACSKIGTIPINRSKWQLSYGILHLFPLLHVYCIARRAPPAQYYSTPLSQIKSNTLETTGRNCFNQDRRLTGNAVTSRETRSTWSAGTRWRENLPPSTHRTTACRLTNLHAVVLSVAAVGICQG